MSEVNSYTESQRYRRVKQGNLTIEGASRAAVQTYWRIPELKLGFDLGWQPWEFMGTPRWFISHTHMDHLLALPAYVARRRMMEMTPPVIYLPEAKVNEVRQLLRIFCRLDHGKLPCQLIGVKPGDTLELSRELVVTVSKTYHSVPSCGYIVWERRKKLKPEYQGFSENELRDLNLAGVPISQEIRIPKIAYSGDSTIKGLLNCPDMFRAEILIMEMTFVAPNHHADSLNKFGHTHLDDLIEHRDRFENQLVIASHFSTRYPWKQIEHIVHKRIPDMLEGRLILW